MKVNKTSINGVIELVPEIFSDHRGIYVETYNRDFLSTQGIDLDFIQDDFSKSKKNVLRGLHGDNKTWKLVSCPHGKIFLVVADMREESESYLKHETFILDCELNNQILIPPGFANGHLVLSNEAIFHYKQTTNYDPNSQFSVNYKDPALNIEWPNIGEFILSDRDTKSEFIS